MKQIIRQRRLHAFFYSKVLNSLMIVIIVSLFLTSYTQSIVLPVACGALAMLGFVGYSLWLLIKRPKTVIINRFISNVCGWYALYFLIIGVMKTDDRWWYGAPVIFSVVVLFVVSITNYDEVFQIN